MNKKMVISRILLAFLVYSLLLVEYFIIYPLRDSITAILPLIVVLGIIGMVSALIIIESFIMKLLSKRNDILVSYLILFFTIIFLLLMIMPEVIYKYSNKQFAILCVILFSIIHYFLLSKENKIILKDNLNISRESLVLLKKYNNIQDNDYYKYSNVLLKINYFYILFFGISSLIFRRVITIIYLIVLFYLYLKTTKNSEIIEKIGKKRLVYEICYQFVLLSIVFLLAKYINGFIAVVIISLIVLPVRMNVSKLF